MKLSDLIGTPDSPVLPKGEPRTPKSEIKPRPSGKRKPDAATQKNAPGTARKPRRRPSRIRQLVQWMGLLEPASLTGLQTKVSTEVTERSDRKSLRERIAPFVPCRTTSSEPKRPTKHKRGEGGPAWEFLDEPSDEDEFDEKEESRRKRLTRAAAFNVGVSRSRKIGMRKNSSTTAQVCAAYPLGVHSAAMQRGVFLGHDSLGGGGAFIYDPFEALEALTAYGVTNTNMMLFGQPGQGKSALIKTMLERTAAVYGTERFTVICDVKGEYGVLAERMGLTRVALSPSGSARVNPLEFVGRARSLTDITSSRIGSVEALVTMVMPDRDNLTMIEKHVLSMVMERFAARPTVQPILRDVVDSLNDPTEAMTDQAKMGQWELQQALTPMRLAVQGLLGSQFGGMFNGHSTVTMDPDGPGVVIDISEASGDESALALIWIAASTWLRMLMLRDDGRRKIQVFDESWKMVRYEPLAIFLQDSWKLMRTKGGANIAILHRLSDLSAQAPDGSPTAKMAQGLISDTAVRVTYKQTPRDLAMSADLAGYGPGELARIATLVPGQSFWKLGDLAVQLDHKLHGRRDLELCDTNALVRRPIAEM